MKNYRINSIPLIKLFFPFVLSVQVIKTNAQQGGGQLPQISGDLSRLIVEQNLHSPMVSNMYNPKLKNDQISLNNVTGNPYNFDTCKLALLIGYGKSEKWLLYAKINEVNGEVYFHNNAGVERALDKGVIKMMVFYKNKDTSEREKVYISNDSIVNKKNEYGNPFMEVMNKGKYVFLKRDVKEVRSADSLFGTQKRYFYSSYTKYYIMNGQKIDAIGKLNKENVLVNIPNSKQYDQWINDNKINFKKEQDIIRFLNYYNNELQQ